MDKECTFPLDPDGNKKRGSAMKFDDILVEIGEFGWYQKRVYFLMSLPAMLCGAQVMSVVFTMAIPYYRCTIPGWPDDTYAIQSPAHSRVISEFIPLIEDGYYGPYDGCYEYSDFNSTAIVDGLANFTLLGNATDRNKTSCSSWVYDLTEFDNTIMSEFDANCDDTIFRSHGNMAAAVGSMVGAVTLGAIADLFGRKKAILLSLVIFFCTTLALYFAHTIVEVIVIKAVMGIATQTTFSLAITAGLELVGPNKRTFAGMMIEFYWIIGVLLVLPIAYYIRSWRNTQLVLCLCSVPLFSLWWLIPESPRWLLDKKKFAEVEKVLDTICKSNNTKLPKGSIGEDTVEDQGPEARLWEVFTHKKLMLRTAIIFFNWTAVSLLYYGLSLNVGNLDGSTYLNYMYGSLVEGLAYVICFALLERTGRRVLYCACMLIGGIACVVVVVPEQLGSPAWVTTLLSMVGKLGVSGGYALVYITSAELFPTVVRTSAMGTCAIFENLGAIVAPYIADLAVITGGRQELPLVVFGAISIASGLASMALPETLHKTLPETVQDSINFV